jgi:anaerobic dimethyl sulfoxide reductase subunit C (anchor subunit)
MAVQWPLVVLTLFICLASGTFGGAGLLAILGKGQKLQIPATIIALIALAIGGIASFLHLQHWDRAFNGFGNPTSGITQELIGIVVFVLVLALYFIVSRRGETPKWAGVLALVVSIALVVVMTGSYLMPARPIWATPLLYVFYLSQMIAAGGAALWLLGAAVNADDSGVLAARITAVGGILIVIALAAYAVYISAVSLSAVGNYFDPTDPTKPMVETTGYGSQLLTGSLAAYFWIALIVGGVIAAVLGLLKWRKGDGGMAFGAVALICTLGGGIAFRAALYVLGVSAFVFY